MSASNWSLPLGVAILAVLIGIFGLIYAVVGALLLIGFAVGVPGLAAFGVGFIGGILLLIVGIVILAVARGLWDQELWALVVSLIVVGVLLLSDVLRGALLTLGGIIVLVLFIYLIVVHRHFD